MTHRKVRAGEVYVYRPVLLDKLNPPYNITDGAVVVVVHKHGCPPPNTMGMCYVNHVADDSFAGLVCTNSLEPLSPKMRMLVDVAQRARKEEQ